MRNPTLCALVAAVMLSACTSDTDDVVDTGDSADTEEPAFAPLVLDTRTDAGLSVELLAERPLQVGWNPIWFRLATELDATPVTSATVTQAPLMQMAMDQHACPFTDPDPVADDNGVFGGELVLIMASGMMGSWSNTVTVHDTAAGTDHTVVFADLAVAETDRKKNLTVGSDTYIVTLTLPDAPVVGENPFVLTVHRKESMMSFPPVTDLSVTVTPWMPDMGHGSEGNVDPTYVENGRYHGTAVFSMTGGWTLDFAFSRDTTALGTVQYAIDL